MDPFYIAIAGMITIIIVVPWIIKILNTHQCTWGKPDDEGYQTCEGCKAIRPVPAKGCQHEWEEAGEHSVTRLENTIAIIKTLRCKKCGDLKEYRIKIDD